ncbi:hypothetical protein RFI_15497 [Reticulomyxa filosa]|uniref:Uncharacterized protein n=1 Tax=Reticulomyxa filosa TaxID=46433 RepID=X6N6M1_RETFI|nr:hypothetical protein RFI_15497 [Reticulomyxa filosa]|eukprot:ETO21706.1 hypothetical protein RFI_15497 [Reticulomyxa filosa]
MSENGKVEDDAGSTKEEEFYEVEKITGKKETKKELNIEVKYFNVCTCVLTQFEKVKSNIETQLICFLLLFFFF